MSCNGCRVLRKGCSEACVLRSCLHWIESPEAQGNATLFLAKFFGRSDLLSFVSAVPDHQRPALFQSLLFEACGRTVNPVNGAVGLLSSGNWHVCQAAVDTVLAGGPLCPVQGILAPLPPPPQVRLDDSPAANRYSHRSSLPSATDRSVGAIDLSLAAPSSGGGRGRSGVSIGFERLRRDQIQRMGISGSLVSSEESVMSTGFGIGDRKERKLLNLFV